MVIDRSFPVTSSFVVPSQRPGLHRRRKWCFGRLHRSPLAQTSVGLTKTGTEVSLVTRIAPVKKSGKSRVRSVCGPYPGDGTCRLPATLREWRIADVATESSWARTIVELVDRTNLMPDFEAPENGVT